MKNRREQDEIRRRKRELRKEREEIRRKRAHQPHQKSTLEGVFEAPRPQRRKTLKLNIPSVFSFLEDPEGVLAFFADAQEQIKEGYFTEVQLDHSRCEVLGLCAETLLDATLQEDVFKKGGVSLAGTYPKDKGLAIMLRSTLLNMIGHPDRNLEAEIERAIVRSPLLQGSGEAPERNFERDKAATVLVDYFSKVLKKHGYELGEEGRPHFARLITEVIANAEEHGGHWYARGFSHPSRGQDDECHIVIFNFGPTIYESLSHESTAKSMRDDVTRLVQAHMKKGFFKLSWNEECLWTLYALQQGVSRYKGEPKGRTRGNGTIEMIEAFSALASTPQKMCIVSGSAYILFDGKYTLKEKRVGFFDTPRKFIAFNDQNDLESAPNPDYVYKLKGFFPGTIISLRFPLNDEHLMAKKEQLSWK